MERKAKEMSEWLKEGHRIQVNLFLRGRAKYLDRTFLQSRFGRLLKLVVEEHKIVDGPRSGPKGLSIVVEKDRR